MKITASDERRTHTLVVYRDGERTEDTIWGDVRTVDIALEPGEVDDIMSNSERVNNTMMRPTHARLRWQRNRHWAFGAWGNQTWISGGPSEDWELDNAVISGPNIRKDGSVGEQGRALSNRRRDSGMPNWFAELIAEYDPVVHGSPLDTEPLS
jgi:hypothetical protein